MKNDLEKVLDYVTEKANESHELSYKAYKNNNSTEGSIREIVSLTFKQVGCFIKDLL